MSSGVAVRVGGLDGTTFEFTRREWYAAVLEIARETACRGCRHAAYMHRPRMLGSNVHESCDNISIDAALRSTCLCRHLDLPESEARRVAEWMIAERVAKALDGGQT